MCVTLRATIVFLSTRLKGDPVWGEGREWKHRIGKEIGTGEGKKRKRKTCSPRSFCPSEFGNHWAGEFRPFFPFSLYLSPLGLSCTFFSWTLSPRVLFWAQWWIINHNSKTQAPSRWWKMAALFFFISSLWMNIHQHVSFHFIYIHTYKYIHAKLPSNFVKSKKSKIL